MKQDALVLICRLQENMTVRILHPGVQVTAMASEDKLGVDFADLYANSGVAR